MLMHYVLAIDVAKEKSMGTLISSCGEVLIEPYEFKHSKQDFSSLLVRIKKLDIKDVSVIMESTGIYHRSVERFFLENHFKVYVINPLYSKNHKNSLRKTKTDKLDCLSLAELFFTHTFREVVKPSELYLNMNALSRQYFALSESNIDLKNRYKNLLYLCFPEYEKIFVGNMVYSDIALSFISQYPHPEIISKTRLCFLQTFFERKKFRYWKSKATKIKEIANTSYPSVNYNDEIVANLSQIAKIINNQQNNINIVKEKLINFAKCTPYFTPINSIDGIGEFTAAIIIAELGDINRFNNIKELTAYCGLDPTIKQSGKTINTHGPISKSGNKYMRHILFLSVLNIVRITSLSKKENDIEIYYRKKRNEGKHHYVATIATTTKLLRKIFAVCKQINK